MSKNVYLDEIDKALITLNNKKVDSAIKSTIPFSQENVANGSFKKIAFDVYKVDNDPYESLWMLQDCDDGQHLVRASDPQYGRDEKGDWSAISDYNRENITLAYKGVPITRFSSKDFNFEPQDALTFKSALLDMVQNDSSFIKDLIKAEPQSKKLALSETFPEFKKFI